MRICNERCLWGFLLLISNHFFFVLSSTGFGLAAGELRLHTLHNRGNITFMFIGKYIRISLIHVWVKLYITIHKIGSSVFTTCATFDDSAGGRSQT